MGQTRMAGLVQADRKAILNHITTLSNQGMQESFSECTTRQSLKKMGDSSR